MIKEIIPSEKTVAICGLGYVGYAVSLLFAEKGFNVIGIDIDKERIKKINSGERIIEGKEPGLEALAKKVAKMGTLEGTTDPARYADADYILVMVQTPVGSEDKIPAYTHLKAALKDIGTHMQKGVTVIIESTIAPGTCEHVIKPELEKHSGMTCGKDFYLAHCPERLMPGHMIENVTEYNRVIGGYNKVSAERAKALYKHIVKGDLDITTCTTAEVVKTTENTYRDVQIAFANEIALICEALGANVWEVRELVNKCKKITDTRPEALRQMHYPGAGVGGHCIPKDSWLLISRVRDEVNPKIIPDARAVNDFMPLHMFELLTDAAEESGKSVNDLQAAVLAYAYDANSDDTRNTPTEVLLSKLNESKVPYTVHDPYVKPYNEKPLQELLKNSNAIVLMKAHDEYRELDLAEMKTLMKTKKPIIIDGANVFDKKEAEKAGFLYKGVGNT